MGTNKSSYANDEYDALIKSSLRSRKLRGAFGLAMLDAEKIPDWIQLGSAPI